MGMDVCLKRLRRGSLYPGPLLVVLFEYISDLIESFNHQFQIGGKERDAVKWGWEQEMGNTMFHVVNAYTRAAQFEGLPAEASYRLQKVGGMVLRMVK